MHFQISISSLEATISLSKYKASTLALAEIQNENSRHSITKICDCRAVLQAEKAAKELAKKAGVVIGPDPITVPSGEKEGQGVADEVFGTTTQATAALVTVVPPPELAETLHSHKEMQPSSHGSSAASLSEAEQLEFQQELLAVESLTKHPQDGDGMDLTEKGFRLRANIAAELFDDWTAPAGSEIDMTDNYHKDDGAHIEPHVGPRAAAAATTTTNDDDDDDDSWTPW